MTRPIELFQDASQYITVAMNTDIQTATEIELTIDCYPPIAKTLSAGEIGSVTETGFRVTIEAEDTAEVKPGPYKYQARATISAKKYNIAFTPNKVKIMDSVFVDDKCAVPGDYCC